jgi:hypothetical protein
MPDLVNHRSHSFGSLGGYIINYRSCDKIFLTLELQINMNTLQFYHLISTLQCFFN